ncbi:hypothetical protein Thimo_3737 (plasmid) [Thioflavicoccus mobilis 8321]|uniref:Uncharacterized protein n=2 Tax=Thioflavicoccus mobilis TaxID=80679 RepID=L0H466_9GAMM|nr:hypothetical protein Thimo_3737 [Thioflavicoccus mobilis 8321]
MKDGIPTCPDCGGPMHLESSAYGRAWECDRRVGVGGGCEGAIQLREDDELTELQIAEAIARRTLGGDSSAHRQGQPEYHHVIGPLEEIARSGYLSGPQRRVLEEARVIVKRLASAAALAKDQARRQEKAREAAVEGRCRQAMGLLGPSLAPDTTRLEASVVDLLALARFGGDACSTGPDILANDSIEALENLLSSRAAGEQRTAADVIFADLLSAHQGLREGISRDWSARSEPIEDLHARFIATLPRLREAILSSPPPYLQVVRRLLAEIAPDNVVPLAPRLSSMTPIPNQTRRRVISAFRFHSQRSPAESAALLTSFAVKRGLSDPRRPPPGSALEQWATAAKAPLWAVQAAASWLDAHATVTDPEEQAAVAAVLEQTGGGGEG